MVIIQLVPNTGQSEQTIQTQRLIPIQIQCNQPILLIEENNSDVHNTF